MVNTLCSQPRDDWPLVGGVFIVKKNFERIYDFFEEQTAKYGKTWTGSYVQ